MLTEIQAKKLNHFFNILDNNKNGVLQEDDFAALGENTCIVLGIPVSHDEYARLNKRSRKLFNRLLIDLNKEEGDAITRNEWLTYFDEQVINSEDNQLLKDYILLTTKQIFDLFDQNNDGHLSIDEYVDMFTIYNIDVKYSAKSFLRLDKNNDNELSKVELFNAITDFFITDEPDASGNWIFGNWEESQGV